jgi:hypothetical protein
MPSTSSPYSRACAVFGCPRPVTFRGRCTEHSADLEHTRGLDSDRHLGAPLYKTARWARLRQQMLSTFPLCQCSECIRLKRRRHSEVVHHIRHHGGDEQRFFDVNNLQALAKVCHDRITALECTRS